MVKKNYYAVLNIERNASADEIKQAYRRLAFEFHPDRNPEDEEAEERFKNISEAYAVLSDPEKRNQYDGRVSTRSYSRCCHRDDYQEWISAADFFEQFFMTEGVYGGFWFRGMRHEYENRYQTELCWERSGGRPVFDLVISAEEAAAGTRQELLLRQGWKTGRVIIQIPSQVRDGTTFRVALGGHTGFAEDLFVRIRIR